MSTANNRYDHPQYTVSHLANGVIQPGSTAGKNVTFTAFADSIVRAVHVGVVAAGTNTAGGAASLIFGVKYLAAGGASSTSTLISSLYGTDTVGTSVLSTTTLSRGDVYRVQSTGTDLTAILSVGIEYTVIPGASYTS